MDALIVAAKSFVSIALLMSYLSMVLLTGSEREKEKLQKLTMKALSQLGLHGQSHSETVGGLISVLSAIAIPLIALTTFLSIPEDIQIVHKCHNSFLQKHNSY